MASCLHVTCTLTVNKHHHHHHHHHHCCWSWWTDGPLRYSCSLSDAPLPGRDWAKGMQMASSFFDSFMHDNQSREEQLRWQTTYDPSANRDTSTMIRSHLFARQSPELRWWRKILSLKTIPQQYSFKGRFSTAN